MGHQIFFITRPRFWRQCGIAMLALTLLTVASSLLSDRRTAAAALIGCESAVPGRSTEGLTYTLDLNWDLGPVVGSGTIATTLEDLGSGVNIDLDGDARSDGTVVVLIAAANANTGDPNHDTYFGAADFVAENPAHRLLVEGYGLDYAQDVTTAPLGNDDLVEGPVHLQFLLFLADPANWDAGTFGVNVTANYIDGSHDVYDIRLDTTGADVSGSTTTTTPWPPGIGVALFDDKLLHDTLAVGINTAAGLTDQTIVPMSNLFVDVQIDQIDDVARNDHVRVGLTGALADDGNGNVTSVGMPGEMAVAIVNECDSLPQETFAGVSHNGTGTMPDTFDVDLSIYGGGDFDGTPGFDPDTERTLYVDGTVTDPPNLVGLTIGADDVDVDGDGNLDGFSLDDDHGTDGIPDDRLPWEYVAVHHTGTAAGVSPDLDAVIAHRPINAAEGEIYVAASIDALPNDTSFDRAGIPTATDADGVGGWDDVNGDGVVDRGDVALNADVGAIAFCAKDRTIFPAPCISPAVAAGRIQVGFRNEVPDAETGGSLPVEYESFSPAPHDLDETEDDHFPLTPADWVTMAADTTTTQDAVGFDVVHADIQSAGIDVTGVEELAWDLRTDGRVSMHANALDSFGAEISIDDATGGATGSIWSVLADAPDDLDLSFDSAGFERDGDPVEVTWDTRRKRTGAAVAVDAFLPDDDLEQGAREIAASAWVGTGNGAADGLLSNSVLTVDLDGRSGEISLEPLPPPIVTCVPRFGLPCIPAQPIPAGPLPEPMAFDAGFTTRTEEQEAAGLALRGKVSVDVPREFTLAWFDDGTTLASGELSTCAAPTTCPVSDIAATVVNTAWTDAVGHDALLGVDMIPVPDEDGREFPDFTALAGTVGYPQDWAHVVLHDDPHMMNTTPDDEEVDEGNEAGFDVHLAELTTVRLGASTTFFDPSGPQGQQEVFNRLDVCFEGATQEPRVGEVPALGLGFYQDEYPEGRGEPAAAWVDATLTLGSTDLRTTVQTNTPAPDSGGIIGDLTAAQAEYAEAFADEANLVETTNWDCDQNEQGSTRTLTGRVRRGTESSVGKVLTLGTQSAAGDATGIAVPPAPGIDAAIYAAEAGSTAYQALDAAVRLDVTNVGIRQPLLRQCGVGNRQLDICADFPAYDATTSSEVYLGITSISESGIGDLDVEYLTEPSDPQDSATCDASALDPEDARMEDACALRAAVHVDHMGPTFTVDGTLDQRRRDGYLRTDLTLKNSSGDLAEVEATYRDDYDPATLGDLSEHGDDEQPLASLVLQRVGRTLTIDSTVWAPVYGWRGSPYDKTDCRDGWPGAIRDSHYYPDGDDPSTWATNGPRPTDTLRPAYLHGRINLDPEDDGDAAETVIVEVDSRVDEAGNYEGVKVKKGAHENWYDDPHRQTTKVGLETDGVLTEGEVWGAFPGLQTHMHENPTLGEFETCVDADMPLHLSWIDVSDVRGALDLLKATVSVPDADKNAGGDATLAVEERLSSDFVDADPRVVKGLWASEVKSWLRSPLGKDWASDVVNARMSVGMLDPGNLSIELPPHDEVGVQSDFASGWNDGGLNGGRFWGSVIFQALFHESVEAEVAEDKGIQDWVDAWVGNDGLWTTVDEMTESRITAWVLPELAPDTAAFGGPFAYQTHHECVDVEKNAVNDEFEPTAITSDGSTFEFAARWDNQRVQLYLIGKYSNGQVRFVRELFDGDPGPKACMLDLSGSFNINEFSGRIEVDLDLAVTAKEVPTVEDWTVFDTDTFVFDPSGNGWVDTSAGDQISAVTPTAGLPVVLSGGMSEVPGVRECVWYPGDGTRITPDDDDIGEGSRSATHTYAFDGTYHAMQLCYVGAAEGADPFPATVREGIIKVRT